MNENPLWTGRNGSPPQGVPALVAAGPRDVWQPPAGYPSDDSPYGQTDAHNFVQDLRRYFWILFRHRWAVAGVTAAFLTLGVLVTFLSTPVYRASTTIQIDREPAKILNVEEIQTDLGNDAAFYATQYELLKSRSLADRVAADLSVEDMEAFAAENTVSPIRKAITAIVHLISPRSDAPDSDPVARLQNGVAEEILDRLVVQPVGTSRVVKLSFSFPDPAWAQRIVNAVANTFLSLTLERRFEASSYARGFLEDRLKELKVKLEDSEAQLVRYAQEQKIVNVDERKSLVVSNLGTLADQLAEAGRARLKAEQLLNQAETTNGLSLPQTLIDESVRSMRERRSALSAQYQDQLRFFKPAYPDMVRLKAQIDEIDRQIESAVDVVKDSIRGEYQAALAEEQSLAREVDQLKAEVLDLESRGIRYRILQREVDTNRQLYDGLLQRFKEVGVAGAVGTNNVSVVDAAELPQSPYKPRLSFNLALSLAFGLFFGALAAFGIEFLDDTFKVPEDIESTLNLPVLGIIPIADATDAFANPRSSVSEAYRSLRTALQFSTAEGAPKTLLVTSSRPSEGKSTTALALARNFAQLGLRVLLIDGDLRNPSLHRNLGLPATAGLSNYLTGNALPSGVFQRVEKTSLTFMACGPLPPNPAELLAGPKMSSLLAVASERFDIVIIDGPPVMGIADAPLLASIASGTLLVIEAGQARRGLTRAALKRLHFARAQMVGALLSKFNARDVGHTYGYGYGYGYGDTEYYGYGSQSVPQLEEALAEEQQEKRQGAA